MRERQIGSFDSLFDKLSKVVLSNVVVDRLI